MTLVQSRRSFRVLAAILLWIAGAQTFVFAQSTSFPPELPFPSELRFKVEFWKAVYTKYTTQQGLIHDSDDLSIIYDALELPPNGNQGVVDVVRSQIRENLFNILRKRGENLTVEERRILSRFPRDGNQGPSRSRLLQASENIRFQLGQADRFRQGIIRSGYYMKYIEEILKEEGVPEFIKYLPHPESSFQEYAFSKFGAAGLWQIMPATAKEWLKVNYVIDERLDPWLATRAAAKYLRRDYARMKAWPLAITAYNHGGSGVMNAVKTLGTTDIAEIAFNYSSPSFGFASRNYYVQFLAAVDVASNYKKYFGDLPIAKPLQFQAITLKEATYLKDLEQRYRFTEEEFRLLNPALRKPVLMNFRAIPKGTLVRMPKNSARQPQLIAAIDRKAIAAANKLKKETEADRLAEIKVAPPEIKKSISVATASSIKAQAEVKKEVPPVKSAYAVESFLDGKGWITIEMDETINQVAEWLKVDTSDLRGWNGMDPDAQVRVGQRVLVKMSKTTLVDFEQERTDYHTQIKEDFYSRYEVAQLDNYEVKRGENLWSLCYQKFEIPPWLLKEYNPTANLTSLAPGTKLKIPQLRERDGVDLVSSTQ